MAVGALLGTSEPTIGQLKLGLLLQLVTRISYRHWMSVTSQKGGILPFAPFAGSAWLRQREY